MFSCYSVQINILKHVTVLGAIFYIVINKLINSTSCGGTFSRDEIGIEARLYYGDGDASVWTTRLSEWEQAGATHVSFNTMGHGFDTPEKHLAAIRLFADVAGLG